MTPSNCVIPSQQADIFFCVRSRERVGLRSRGIALLNFDFPFFNVDSAEN